MGESPATAGHHQHGASLPTSQSANGPGETPAETSENAAGPQLEISHGTGSTPSTATASAGHDVTQTTATNEAAFTSTHAIIATSDTTMTIAPAEAVVPESDDSLVIASTSIPSSSTGNAVDRATSPVGAPDRPMSNEAQPEEGGPDDGEEYIDDDGGVIRCICGCDDDDGFTIQCDQCLVWQHCACFGMSQASVPEVYRCEQCDPRPVDVAFAKAHQQRRRDAEARKNLVTRHARRQSQSLAQSDAQDTFAARESFEDSEQGETRKNSASDGKVLPGQSSGSLSRSRKPTQQLDLSSIKFQAEDNSTSTTPGSAKQNRKRGVGFKSSMGRRTGEVATTPRTSGLLSGITTPTAAGADRNDAELDSLLRNESWNVEFTPTRSNIVNNKRTRVVLDSFARDYREHGSPLKAYPGSGTRMITHVVGKKVKILSEHQHATESLEEENDVSMDDADAALSRQSLPPAIALSAIGNECIPVELSVPSLAACSQKTYVRQISEMASASIFNSLAQNNVAPSEPQRSSSANRMFSKPVMHGLFADASIPAGCFISELCGEISSADAYRKDPINQYKLMGATKPCVHLLPPPLNLCIDSRRYGNTARFARFSCHPNAVLRPIMLRDAIRASPSSHDATMTDSFDSLAERDGHTSSIQEVKGGKVKRIRELQFGLFAIADISKGHEITLGWEWDDEHLVHMLPQLVRAPMLGVYSVRDQVAVDPRKWDRETRNAAITALVEKGEFPYADTLFSAKMNSIMTVLLSSCLCACIGSAAGPNSGTSASANNVKRQDCAIVQMLRLSQGMGLLNVNLPTHKSNRKSKAPDFEPLVEKKRWWRPEAMPPTPPGLVLGDGHEDWMLAALDMPFKLEPGGKVGRVSSTDFERAVQARKSGRSNVLDDEVEEADDIDDAASSATEPLDQTESDDMSDLRQAATRFDVEGVTIARQGDKPFLVQTALPLKKRVSGTRLKAVSPEEDEGSVENNGKKRARKDDLRKLSKIRRSNKRKGVVRPPGDKTDPREEEEGSDDDQYLQKFKKSHSGKSSRKSKAVHPSSPLSSAPASEDEDLIDEDDATSVSVSEEVGSRRRRASDVTKELKSAKKRANDAQRERSKESKMQARKRELLGDFLEDSDASEEEKNDNAAFNSATKTSKSSKKAKRKKVAAESDDEAGASASVEPTNVTEQAQPIPMPNALEAEMPASTSSEFSAPTASTFPAAPPPPVEVPKAKLSLADYKKRLAERRTSSQSGSMTPSGTPALQATSGSPEKPSLPGTPMDTPTPGTASAMYTGLNFPFPIHAASVPTFSTSTTIVSTPASSQLVSDVSTSVSSSSRTTTIKSEFKTPQPLASHSFIAPPPPPPPPQPPASLASTLLDASTPTLPSQANTANAITSVDFVGDEEKDTSVSTESSLGRSAADTSAKDLGSHSQTATDLRMSALSDQDTAPTSSSISATSAPISTEVVSSLRNEVPSKTEHSAVFSETPERRSSSADANRDTGVGGNVSAANDTASDTSFVTSSRNNESMSSSGQARRQSLSFGAGDGMQGTDASFNPPKGPKALLNATSSLATSSSVPAPSAVAPSSSFSTNSGASQRRPSVSLNINTSTQQGPRSRGPSIDEAPSYLSNRNPSPVRPAQTTPIGSAAPGSERGAGLPTPSPTSGAPSGNLTDFANVPKGPARMRERETMMRDRERDWERDREWERDAPLAGMGPQWPMHGREYRDPRDPRDSRDPRGVRDMRDARDVRDVRDPRDPRDPRDSRDPRGDSHPSMPSRAEWDARENSFAYEHDYRMDERGAPASAGGGGAYGYDRSRRLDEDRYERPLPPPGMGSRRSPAPPSPSLYASRYGPVHEHRLHDRISSGGPGYAHPNAPPPPHQALGRSGPPPMRGGYGRGGGGPAPWSGRARTRGRGSRGAW